MSALGLPHDGATEVIREQSDRYHYTSSLSLELNKLGRPTNAILGMWLRSVHRQGYYCHSSQAMRLS